MKGRLIDLTVGMDGRQRVTVALDGDMRETFSELHADDVEITVKKYRRKRSLDANAYAWTLIDKLAAKLNLPKADVYRELIRSIGGVSQTVCVINKAVDALIDGWKHNGLGWFGETFPSKIDGCTNVILYFGSSTYDTKQMSDLIDYLVEACKMQGIETATPEEIAKYKEEWKA